MSLEHPMSGRGTINEEYAIQASMHMKEMNREYAAGLVERAGDKMNSIVNILEVTHPNTAQEVKTQYKL